MNGNGGDNEDLPPGIIRSRPRSSASPSSPPREEASVREVAAPRSPTPRESEAKGTGRISAIDPQERHKNRVSVFIEGKFALGLFADVAHTLGLRVGQQITAERLEEIAQAETKRKALEDAYRLLSFRARSEAEIRKRLQRKGYEEEVVTQVTTRLRDIGFLNDEAFAQSWVDARGKTRGRRALAFELRQKGVANEVARQTLDERKDEDAEQEAAKSAAVKKVGLRPADRSREAQAKLSAFLQRRGFAWNVIRPVLAELYGALPEEEEQEEQDDDGRHPA